MSQYNSISTLLKIQDKNIQFHLNAWEDTKIQGMEALVFYATLTYSVETCPSCGGNHVIRHGTKLSKIKILDVSNTPTYLHLKKQRFFCKTCSKTFSASTNFIRKHFYKQEYKL